MVAEEPSALFWLSPSYGGAGRECRSHQEQLVTISFFISLSDLIQFLDVLPIFFLFCFVLMRNTDLPIDGDRTDSYEVVAARVQRIEFLTIAEATNDF